MPTCLVCLHALRAYVHANVPRGLTCSHAKVHCMLTRSYANMSCVLTCYVPTCLECLHVSLVNMPCVLSFSRVEMPWIPYFTWFVWPRDHLTTLLACLLSSFDVTFFSFTAIVVELVHNVGKVWQFKECLSSVTWIHI